MASKRPNMSFRPPLPPQISRKPPPPSSSNRLNINSSYMNFNTMDSLDFQNQATEGEQIEHIEDMSANDDNEDLMMNTKKNLTWDMNMDDFLINCLADQVLLGQKIGGSFTSSAYRTVAKKVTAKFGVNCQSSHVINCLKTVKQNFALMHDLMSSASGFEFTRSTQRIEAEESVWEAYLAKKPRAKKYRDGPARNYEKLLDIFGKDCATGSRAAGPSERKRRLMSERNNIHNDDNELNFEHEVDSSWSEDNANLGSEPIEPNLETSSTSVSKSSTHTKKRNKKVFDVVLEELRSIGVGLSDVFPALNRANVQNFDDTTLFQEIEKINEMSEITRMKVYQALTKDVNAARAFLRCPITSRQLWLEVQFGAMLHEDQI